MKTNAKIGKNRLVRRLRGLAANPRYQKPAVALIAILLVAGGYFFVRFSRAATALPLGTLNFVSSPVSCPAGDYTCRTFTVSCPEVASNEQGTLAIAAGQGTPRGLIVLVTGGDGGSWWTEQPGTIDSPGFVADLRAQGYSIAQVKWKDWLSARGNATGTPGHARLGCRPATIVKYIHDTYYQPLGVTPPRAGECGFCITGNSGGSSQVAYTISHYGLDSILNAVLPTDGPPHSVLEKACLRTPGEEAYWYFGLQAFIDEGFAYFNKDGPCYNNDAGFRNRWATESSIATSGNDYYHPATRVHFIFNTDGMRANGGDYEARLRAANSPLVLRDDTTNTPHNVTAGADGRAKLMAALLWQNPGGGTSPPPPPPANTPPTAAITAPASGTSYTAPATVNITASASDSDGTITKVEFYRGTTKLAEDTTSPYSYNWTNVAAGSYSLTAKATDNQGATTTSAAVSVSVSAPAPPPPPPADTTPPSTPANLTATAASATQVNLTWQASTDNTGVTKYLVQRGGTTIAQTTTPGYSDTTVLPGTNYTYRILAADAANNTSPASNNATVTTPQVPDTTPPSTPIGLSATAVSGTQVNLTWQASTDNVAVAGYRIYRDGIIVATSATTSFGESSLTPGTTYQYRVQAFDGAGNESGLSANRAVSTPDNPPPQVISGDINGDSKVNIFDLSILLNKWGSNDSAADLNKNGKVDIFDLSIQLSNWSK